MKTVCLLLCAVAAHAQLITLTKDQMVKMTAKNPFERFEDGRPKVPDSALQKIKIFRQRMSGAFFPAKVSRIISPAVQINSPGQKARRSRRYSSVHAGTRRPERNHRLGGQTEGLLGGQNQWIIDQLQPGDVMVVDLFGKDEYGTFVGDNLAYYIMKKTGAGLVVDGAVRDLDGIANSKCLSITGIASDPYPRCDVDGFQCADPNRRHHGHAW